MQPAQKRTTELLAKWLQSLELHRRYASLSNEDYWQVQPWAPHQRPAPWIVEVARTRVLELQSHLATRLAAGDNAFAESLELMSFLATLVGVQDIERYIPLAEAPSQSPVEPPPPPADVAPPPSPAAAKAKTKATATIAPATPSKSQPTPTIGEEPIIADAVRLLKWGREWHELAPAIARIADRPGVVELRRVLRAHKARIEAAVRE